MLGTGSAGQAARLAAVATLLVAGLTPAAGALDVSTKAIKVVASSEYNAQNVDAYAGQYQGYTGELNGRGGAIAVLDTGVDDGHPTFEGAFAAGAYYDSSCGCMKDTTPTGDKANPDDTDGHGTHVASIALGRGGEGGARGVAPGAQLVDVKITGPSGGVTSGGIEAGIQWVLDYNKGKTAYAPNPPVRVIALSFGSFEPHQERDYDDRMDMVRKATNAGLLVVTAAGNCGPGSGDVSLSCPSGGSEQNTIASPGATPEALTVAALDDNNSVRRGEDHVAPYSSRGPNPAENASDTHWRKPDVAAPGSNISAACHNAAGQNAQNMDCVKNGTSMAAPHVAGLAAVVWQALDELSDTDPTPKVVKDLITSTATDWGPDGWDAETGYGYVDGYHAVVEGTNTPPISDFVVEPIEPDPGQQVTLDASSSYDPDNGDQVDRFVWTIDGDTVKRPRDQPRIHRIFDQPGNHTVELTTVDTRGTKDPEPFRRTIHVEEAKEETKPSDPPKVNLTYGPQPVRAEQVTWFDAANSTDPDGDALTSFEWDFDAGGEFAVDRETSTPRVNWTFEEEGRTAVSVRVTDETGKKTRETVTIDVQAPPPGPPSVDITNPQDGDILEAGPVNVTWTVRENPAESFGVTVDGVAIDDTDNRFLVVNLSEGDERIAVKAQGIGGSDTDRVNVTVQQREVLQQSSADGGSGQGTGQTGPAPARPGEPNGSGGADDTAPAPDPPESGLDGSDDEASANETPGPGLAGALGVLVATTVAWARARRPG